MPAACATMTAAAENPDIIYKAVFFHCQQNYYDKIKPRDNYCARGYLVGKY
jgi:hypothetical protein